MGGNKIKMITTELNLLIEKRKELIKYISTHNLQYEKHYMKFLELQDVNLSIIKLDGGFKFD